MNRKRMLFITALVFLFVGCSHNGAEGETERGLQEYTDSSIVTEWQTQIQPTPESAAVTGGYETTSVLESGASDLPGGFGAESVITLKNLPIDRAVQQFAFYEENGQAYVLAVQRKDTTAYLSRCQVNERTKNALRLDYAELKGYGHGESMDVSFHNGELYVLITSGANPVNSYAWGTQITRLKYRQGNIQECGTLTDLACVGPDGSPVFEGAVPYRINFGLDDVADVLTIYARIGRENSTSNPEHHLVSYRLSALHKRLDEAQSVSSGDCAQDVLAFTGAKKSKDICPNGSFQGMDVGADGSIRITGGTTSTPPQMSVFEMREGKIERAEPVNIDFMVSRHLGTRDFRSSTSYVEIESIKYHRDGWYCIFNPAGDMEKDSTEIYILRENKKQ